MKLELSYIRTGREEDRELFAASLQLTGLEWVLTDCDELGYEVREVESKVLSASTDMVTVRGEFLREDGRSFVVVVGLIDREPRRAPK